MQQRQALILRKLYGTTLIIWKSNQARQTLITGNSVQQRQTLIVRKFYATTSNVSH